MFQYIVIFFLRLSSLSSLSHNSETTHGNPSIQKSNKTATIILQKNETNKRGRQTTEVKRLQKKNVVVSGHGGYGVVWWPHLRQHLVQPLQGSVEMDLNPARSRGDVLPMVLGPPALHERGPDGAHFRQLVDRFEAMVHSVGQEMGKLLGEGIKRDYD